jgi:hypothetical protein
MHATENKAKRRHRPKKEPRPDELIALERPTGREIDSGAAHPDTLLDEELQEEHAPEWAMSEVDPHEPPGPTEDTPDGLDEVEEEVRHTAEDLPTGADPDGPRSRRTVFDRGQTAPKV